MSQYSSEPAFSVGTSQVTAGRASVSSRQLRAQCDGKEGDGTHPTRGYNGNAVAARWPPETERQRSSWKRMRYN